MRVADLVVLGQTSLCHLASCDFLAVVAAVELHWEMELAVPLAVDLEAFQRLGLLEMLEDSCFVEAYLAVAYLVVAFVRSF